MTGDEGKRTELYSFMQDFMHIVHFVLFMPNKTSRAAAKLYIHYN